MNEQTLTPDDPRLTAFALGELDGAEEMAIAAAVAAEPALAAAVQEIRATMLTLEEVLAAEPMPTVSPIELPNDAYPLDDRKVVRFPYFWVSGLMAAGFAVLVVVNDPEPTLQPQTEVLRYEINLSDSASVRPEGAEHNASSPTSETDPKEHLLADEKSGNSQVLSVDPLPLSPEPAESPLPRPAVGEARRVLRQSAREPVNRFIPAVNQLMLMSSAQPSAERDTSQEGYAPIRENSWQRVGDHPLSTFSIDVDTGSYANVRRFLHADQLPPTDAVRLEELINAFTYDYPEPVMGSDAPFAASLEAAAAPWAPHHRLVRIGLKGRDIGSSERAAANLVFLLDVSGSMRETNKLPLVKEAMRLLIGQLRPDDQVAIVTYAGASGLALPSTAVSQRRAIVEALDRLEPAGGTNGAMGIHLAYDIAKANFFPDGINRIILCTDGDFNLGPAGQGDLDRLIAEKAESGVSLTALGFGVGNYQDQTLERLADRGNGSYGYIDSSREAHRLLVEQVNGTLAIVAKDVKIQVEFNPALVDSYRLIGYENRALATENFNDDRVDAGEIGAGHAVTALYEIVTTGGSPPAAAPPPVDDLRYQNVSRALAANVSHELLTVKVRAKLPDGDESRRWDFPLRDQGTAFVAASADFKFATAVAGFGMVLRDSDHLGTTTLRRVLDWADEGMAFDPSGYREEFTELVRQAEVLRRQG